MDPRKYITPKKLCFFVLFGILVFAALVFLGDYENLSESLQKVNPAVIIVLLLLTLLNYAFRFFKWEYYLRVLGIRVPLKSSLLIFLSGLSMAITPGKVGEVFKAQMLKEVEGIERRKTVVVVFAERLTDVVALSILSLLGLSSLIMHAWSIVFILFLMSFIIFFLTNEPAFKVMCLIGRKIPLIKNYVIYGEDVYNNSRKLFTLKVVIFTTVISSISWFFECFALFILLDSLGANVSLMASVFIYSFSSIFGSILVLPGGLGAAEGSFVALLLLSSVPKNVALVATIVIRIATLWFGVIIGLISLFLFSRSLRKDTSR